MWTPDRRQFLKTAGTAAAALSVAGAGRAIAAPMSTIIMGCANSTSSHYALGVAMSRAIKAELPDANVTLLETGGGLDNLKRLERGEVQLGQIGFDAGVNAIRGQAAFKDKPIEDVVVVYPYGISFQEIVVRADSGIEKLEDLDGKPFSPGIRGSSAEAQMRTVFDILGIAPDIVPGTLGDAAEGVQNRQLVGLSVSTAGSVMTAAVRELATTTDLRAISITEEHWAKLKDHMDGLELRPIPPTALPGDQQDVTGLSWRNVWVSRLAVLDDETAYEIAKGIYDYRQYLIDTWPQLADFDFKGMALSAEEAGIPLHPGAKKFWESV
jgi:TRAP transporter TAXI family solute receptor